MTITDDERVTVTVFTEAEARAELARLLAEAGVSRDELQRRADQFELEAHERTLLADIEGLEWMLGL